MALDNATKNLNIADVAANVNTYNELLERSDPSNADVAIASAVHALAEFINQHAGSAMLRDIGTASGNVPIVGTNGELDSSVLPDSAVNPPPNNVFAFAQSQTGFDWPLADHAQAIAILMSAEGGAGGGGGGGGGTGGSSNSPNNGRHGNEGSSGSATSVTVNGLTYQTEIGRGGWGGGGGGFGGLGGQSNTNTIQPIEFVLQSTGTVDIAFYTVLAAVGLNGNGNSRVGQNGKNAPDRTINNAYNYGVVLGNGNGGAGGVGGRNSDNNFGTQGTGVSGGRGGFGGYGGRAFGIFTITGLSQNDTFQITIGRVGAGGSGGLGGLGVSGGENGTRGSTGNPGRFNGQAILIGIHTPPPVGDFIPNIGGDGPPAHSSLGPPLPIDYSAFGSGFFQPGRG